MYDEIALPRIEDGDTPWKVARWVLMLSHLYYDRNASLVDDDEFDAMCAEVADHYDELPEHEQVMLGDPDELRHTGQGMTFSRLIVAQAQRLALDLGENPGPYSFVEKYVCECCECPLTTVRG